MVYKIPNKRQRIPMREISKHMVYKIQNKTLQNTNKKKLVTHGIQDTKYTFENTNKRNQ